MALGIGPGDEVIVPAYTFPATANVVELCGARAVIVDVDPDTFNLDLARVADAVTARTKAVLAVHLFGRPVEWEELQTAVPQEVALIEDAAGALGARYRGTPCGSLGVMGCLSFHPRKIVTTGEGGAVTTDEAELADAIRRFRHHGIVPRGDFDIPEPGLNYRLPDLLCAVGIPQLAAARAAARRARARRRVVHGAPRAPRADALGRRGRPPRLAGVRDPARPTVTRRCGRFGREGIEVQIGTYALHHLGAYRDRGAFPGADRAFARALALPFATTMTEAECDRVAAALARFV